MQDTTRNVFDKISNMYYGLTASEKKTADFVMSHRTETQYMSIADLADASGVAEATVSRFCRTLGYEGYNLFKLAIANASSVSDAGSEMPEGNVTENDSFTEMCQKLFAADRDAMVQTMSVIDETHIGEAVDMLAGAKKVLCMGQGGSMLLASECAHLFSTVAGKFFAVTDSHSQIIAAANMSSDDVLLFFSYSGATRDMLETLDEYYPIVFVDCVHIKIHRSKSVSTEAFYVALAVTDEGTREVLGIFNMPVESATGWGGIFDELKERGVQRIGLMVADGITGLDTVVGKKFPGTPLQRCVTHLKRNMLARVRHGDKAALAEDLRDVFRTGQRDYTVEAAWKQWQDLCEKWGKDYRSFKSLRDNADYKAHLIYLNYAPEIQGMIYTTNWIERLNRDFRRVTRMRTAMPNEESVLTLLGSVAMEHKAFDRILPKITTDKTLFP